jgi:hypothetical protein
MVARWANAFFAKMSRKFSGIVAISLPPISQ